MTEDPSYISLSLLNQLIKEAVQGSFVEEVWLVAEISDVKVAASGHCYLELVEKKNERVLARIKANIWNFQHQKIMKNFLDSTGKSVEKGMKILLLAAVNFHELYGVSLVVKNIDPSFTLGELAKSKDQILKKLRKEGLLDRNKGNELELLPKRIAVISAENAAGYEDFVDQLTKNSKGFVFEVVLFVAAMQGEMVEKEVISALEKIRGRIAEFDSVAIIRGGGASLDLSGFDNYNIAANVANFPLPIITGIGHERDYTVLDHVAHTRLKTPTAVASFYLQQFEEFEEYIRELGASLVHLVQEKISKEQVKSSEYRSKFALLSHNYTHFKKEQLVRHSLNLKRSAKRLLERKHEVKYRQTLLLKNTVKPLLQSQGDLLQKRRDVLIRNGNSYVHACQTKLLQHKATISLLDPINVLKRGYLILKNKEDEFIKSKKELSPGDDVVLLMVDGKVNAKIKQT